ncbi:MAG: saccharopine dehydrogenase [Chitinophagaceae bacterium]|nr:MAG: saccharopine dehydrogenase [Chitinophagaceae bacterium]
MKTILLFGAGKSASVLIKYLIKEAELNSWKFIVADANKALIENKTNGSKFAEAVQLDITDDLAREKLIQRAHVVISMMPPALHFLIAKDCVEWRKHLLTASYLDDNMKSLRDEINHRKLLFLCEMGLDPGIDHMSAMKLIDGIKEQAGVITSFKSHCGGLIAPESDNNPWHYKISWNPRNVVLAGNAGARYLEAGEEKLLAYQALFDKANTVKVPGLDALAYYPNRDSLGYIPVYKLHDAKTFVRTTLRYPAFFEGWNAVVAAGLTSDNDAIDATQLTFKRWSESILPLVNERNRKMLTYLGLFEDTAVPTGANSSADILQYLLETKLAMAPVDKDMIVMLHEFIYELNGEHKNLQSSLVVKGEDNIHTAMAKTVGLPLGIAAKLLLNGTLTLKGLHIPILKEIYEPVLAELEKEGIIFTESLH